MRKVILFILSVLFIFAVSACSNRVYELPWDTFCSKEFDIIELELEEKKYIINLLNEGDWQYDVTKCACDYSFHPQKQSVGYHSECGIFNDYTRKKHIKVTEEQRLKINEFLGVYSYEK